MDDVSSERPACFVVVFNIGKKHNVGTLLRSCTAFGVKQVCLVGSRSFNTFGSHGSAEHVNIAYHPTLEACCAHLKSDEGCEIVGIEISDDAEPVHKHSFRGPTAFMVGNEGQGLSPKQISLCDRLMYIPQHGPGTASLNVTVAASIVLHHFAIWSQIPERERSGAKYKVAERPLRTTTRGFVPLTEEERAEKERLRAEAGECSSDGEGGLLVGIFDHH